MSAADRRFLARMIASMTPREIKIEAGCFHRSWVADNSRVADLEAAEQCWAALG